ncbi:MAG: mechanosensitive ion channel [Woeseia sp.]|nr:mechanosensitive ion channel [Woeseia sp.]
MLLLFVITVHVLVLAIKRVGTMWPGHKADRRYRKLKSIGTLLTSVMIFTLYFSAIGLVFRELNISLTAYFASASVIGIAIGFGSQGVVQDVVTGLTLIFSDLLDVGDLVDVGGQTGIVSAISMRFVRIENALGASVFIPNRTINNVTNYPRGYVRCTADVTLRGDVAAKDRAAETATRMMQGVRQQFPGILLTEPSVEGRMLLDSGKEILRLKFRVWPNRGGPIETTFCQDLAAELKSYDPDYMPWMIAVSYEVEAPKPIVAGSSVWPWRRK